MSEFLFSFNPSTVLLWIILSVLLLLCVLGRYYFFEKIGINGIKGLIPIYSDYLYYEKGNVCPWLSCLFIGGYSSLYIIDKYFINDIRLSVIIILFKAIVVIAYLTVTWNVNFYICSKLKKGLLLNIFLTLFPIITVPIIGLCDKYKWSRLSKVNNNLLLEDYYLGKKVSVSDIFIWNILLVLSVIILFYLFIYVSTLLFSVEKTYEIMWNFKFIIVLIVFVTIFIIGGTILNYFLNKKTFEKNRR